MRILHTADWHLGKQLHSVSLLEDQAHVLEQFHAALKEYSPDCCIIAGDIYDRSIPSSEAVSLFNDTLERLAFDFQRPVFLIAGNHDSPDRLAFGSRILARQQIYIGGRFQHKDSVISLEDNWGKVSFCLLPYLEPAIARQIFSREDIHQQQKAIEVAVNELRTQLPQKTRSVLIAHAFVAGGVTTDSERPLSVGGVETVTAGTFAGFDYVALGHLHAPQQVERPSIRYSGSPLKYSFSEIPHAKSFSLVDIGQEGDVELTEIPISPKRDVRKISGLLQEIEKTVVENDLTEDFLLVRLEDRGALIDPMGRLRSVYPNVLQIERSFLELQPEDRSASRAERGKDERTLFESFYSHVTGEDVERDEIDYFAATVDEMKRIERESH